MKCELARLGLAELQIDPWLEDYKADWRSALRIPTTTLVLRAWRPSS